MRSDEDTRLVPIATVRVTREQHQAFKRACKRQRRSMAMQLRVLIDDFVAKDADDLAQETQAA